MQTFGASTSPAPLWCDSARKLVVCPALALCVMTSSSHLRYSFDVQRLTTLHRSEARRTLEYLRSVRGVYAYCGRADGFVVVFFF